jgi:hypothetical protein
MEKKEFVKPFNGEVLAEGRISKPPYFLQKSTLILILLGVVLATTLAIFRVEIESKSAELFFRFQDYLNVPLVVDLLFIVFFGLLAYALLYGFFYFVGVHIMEIFSIPVVKLEIILKNGNLFIRKKGELQEIQLNLFYHIEISSGTIRLFSINGADVFFTHKNFLYKSINILGDKTYRDTEPEYIPSYADFSLNIVKKYRGSGDELGKYIEAERIRGLIECLRLSTKEDETWRRVHEGESQFYQSESGSNEYFNRIEEFDIQLNFISNEIYDSVMNRYKFPSHKANEPKDFGTGKDRTERKKKFLEKINEITGRHYQYVNSQTIEFVQLSINGRRCSEINDRRIHAKRQSYGPFETSFFSENNNLKLCIYYGAAI